MRKRDIVRAWKDPKYRAGLSEEQRAQLPQNPAGVLELSDSDLEHADGGIFFSTVLCWAAKTIALSCAGSCPSETCDDDSIPISA